MASSFRRVVVVSCWRRVRSGLAVLVWVIGDQLLFVIGLGVGCGLECGALEGGDGSIRPWFGAVRVVLAGVDVSGVASKLSGLCLDSLTVR